MTSSPTAEAGPSFGLSRFGAKKDVVPSACRRDVFDQLVQFLTACGIDLQRPAKRDLTAPIQTDVSLIYPMERIRVWGTGLDMESMKGIFTRLTESIDEPSQVHIIAYTSFEEVRDLTESGLVVPCTCCGSYLSYSSPGAPEPNIDPERVLDVGKVMVEEEGVERFITFGDFTWKHQDPESREGGGNLLQWVVKSPDRATLSAWWMGKFSRKGWAATEEEFRKALTVESDS